MGSLLSIIHLASRTMNEECTQLKGHFVGLLDAVQRESATDMQLADAVAQIVSSYGFATRDALITHCKSILADFMITELTGDSTTLETSQKKLEETIAKMESYLHVLTQLKANITLPQGTWTTPMIQQWALKFRMLFGIFYESNADAWHFKEEYKTLLALFVTPLVNLNPALHGEIWANMKKKPVPTPATTPNNKTKAPDAALADVPPSKKARTEKK